MILETELNPINYVLTFVAFNIIFKCFNTKFDSKRSNILTSIVHALGCIYITGNYLLNKNPKFLDLFKTFSTSHLLYEQVYLIRNWECKISYITYFYHHVVLLLLIYSNPKIWNAPGIFFFTQLEHLPMYFIYIFKKQKNKRTVVKKLRQIRFVLALVSVFTNGKCFLDGCYYSKKYNSYYDIFWFGSIYIPGNVLSIVRQYIKMKKYNIF